MVASQLDWAPYPVRLNSEPPRPNKPSPLSLALPPESQESLLELVSMQDGSRSQAPAVSPRLKRKIQTAGPQQATDYQALEMLVPPLDTQMSKGANLLLHLIKKDDLAQLQRRAKVVAGTPHQLAKRKTQEQTSPEDYVNPSTDGADHDSLDLESWENPHEPPESPGQTAPSHFRLEAQTLHPETPQVQSPSSQQEAAGQLSQRSEEVEASSTQQEAPAQPELAAEEGVDQPSMSREVKSDARPSHSPFVTVNVAVEVTLTARAGRAAQPTPSQQQAPVSPPESPEEAEPSPRQQEAPSQPPGSLGETEPSPLKQEPPAQFFEAAEEVEPSGSQPEAPARIENSLEDIEPPVQEYDPEAAPENIDEVPPFEGLTPQPPDQDLAPDHNLSSVTVRPADVEFIIISEPTREVKGSPAQQETPSRPPGSPMMGDSSPSQQEQPAQPSEAAEEAEPSGSPPEAAPQIEISLEEVRPSVQEDDEALEAPLESTSETPSHHEGTVSTPGHHQAKHSYSPKGTVTPPDLQLTLTLGPAAEAGTSLAVPLDNVESPMTRKEAPTLPPEPSEGDRPLWFQQEAPSSEPVQDEQDFPGLQESTAGSLQASEEGEPPSSTQQEATAAHLQTPEEAEPSRTPQPAEEHDEATVSPLVDDQVQPPALDSVTVEPPAVTSEFETETSAEQEAPAGSSGPPEQFGPFADKREVPAEQPNPAVKDEPPASHSRLPSRPAKPPEEPSARQQESSSLPPDSPARVALAPVRQQLSAQPWGFDVTATVAFHLPESMTFPAYPSEPSPVPQEAAAPPSGPAAETEAPAAQQVPSPQPANVGRLLPVLLPAPSPPPQPPEEVDLSLAQAVEPSQRSHEPLNESVAQPPAQGERTVPPPAQAQAALPPLPSVTSQPSDLEVPIAAEPTAERQSSTALATSAALPPRLSEVTLPHPNLTAVTRGPSDPELTRAPPSTAEARASATVLQTPSQPPEAPKGTVAQTAAPTETRVPTPGQEPARHPTSPRPTGRPAEENLTTTTPAPTTEPVRTTALQTSAAPPPTHPGGTPPHPDQAHTPHPNLTEVTTRPSEVTARTARKEQSAATHTDVCQLCSCQEQTLSCTGLSPAQRLRRVPALEPGAHNTTFTVL